MGQHIDNRAARKALTGRLTGCSIETCVKLGQKERIKTGQIVIELDNVTYGYDGNLLFRATSMSLDKGSFHFLTGPSGAGKTTLLRLCYGALHPDAGRVQLFGKDVHQMDRDAIALLRRRVGVVHQDCQFLDHLSIRENVALPLSVSGRHAQIDSPDMDELLAWVGLAARSDATPAQLSGGERQRAALARAVIMSPDAVLVDEPTGNVDWEMSQRILRLLAELNKMGKTVLIATHDMSLIRAAKSMVQARVLRISNRQVHLAGADL